ncbi:MAG: hypothetical protein NTV80_03030 [Verrucomicrobia bacterium]|nr:hypothetical protein [Verrucomicrobiota bacterium]
MNTTTLIGDIRQDIHTRAARFLLLLLLFLLWLVPLAWIGSTLGNLPFRVPRSLWQQYNAAALFTKRTATWSDRRIEIRTANSDQWRVLNMVEVSPMPLAGYRQRIDRILSDTRSKKIAESLRQRMALWIAQRLKQQSGQEISGVRYQHRSWQANTPELALPAGHWGDNGSVLPATTRVTLLGEYAIVNGRATRERAKPPVLDKVPSQPKVFRREIAPVPPAKT